MRNFAALRYPVAPLLATLLFCPAAWAQLDTGARTGTAPPPTPRTNVLIPSRPAPPAATPSAPPSASQPGSDAGHGSGHRSPYSPYGYPQYPGPDAPLPTPGSYYANPYGYYDRNNPYNPYGYYQNNNGYYNPGYYNPGYYNSGPGGYYSNGYNGSPTGVPSYGDSYPPFQDYDRGRRGR
jgi:hypothetical protein